MALQKIIYVIKLYITKVTVFVAFVRVVALSLLWKKNCANLNTSTSFPALLVSYMYFLRVLIGSPDGLCPL